MASSGHREQCHGKYFDHLGGEVDSPHSIFPSDCYIENGNSTNLAKMGDDHFVHVRCPYSTPDATWYSGHLDSMIIAVSGTCPGDGSDRAFSSGCGVYFGPRNQHHPSIQQNLSFQAPDPPDHKHTNQRAELQATMAGLRCATKFTLGGAPFSYTVPPNCPGTFPISHLVIKSDSEYVVHGKTQNLGQWLKNGWLTAEGKPVKNQDLWGEMIDAIEYFSPLGVQVDFWHVRPEDNRQARSLACKGVDCGFIFADGELRQYSAGWC